MCMKYQLRNYQLEAKQAVFSEWASGNSKTLIVMATGLGKTIVFSSIIEELAKQNKRTLILAHRNELLNQAVEKLKLSMDRDAVICNEPTDDLVIVSSIQGLSRDDHLYKFPKNHFDLIVVDEAHHCLSDTYKKVLKYFSTAKVLGVTATPSRGDMKNLATYFDSKAYEYNLPEAIKDHYLSPVTVQTCPVQIDLSKARINNGDYAAGDIDNALDSHLNVIAQKMSKICKDKKTLVFLPLIKTSQKLCSLLNKYGMSAAEINGTSKERKQILDEFSQGKYNVLTNSLLLTEGYDEPSIDCIVILRPTRSRTLFMQMLGRGTRLCKNKDDLLLLDFLWLTRNQDICGPANLFPTSEVATRNLELLLQESTEQPVDLTIALKQAEAKEKADLEASLAKKLEEARRNKASRIDLVQLLVATGAQDILGFTPMFKWEMKPPTEKQLNFIAQNGIDVSLITNAGVASKVIDRIISRRSSGLSTPKQIKTLERYSIANAGTYTFDQASRIITMIANNSWKLPQELYHLKTFNTTEVKK